MTTAGNSTTRAGSGESPWIWLALFLATLSLGLLFQGTRGIWEPDEGFYSNVSLGMLTSHNWWLPRLNGEVFLDKPPLVYWSIGGGMALLGVNEWGARAAHAFFFAGTALIVGLLAARWWGRRTGVLSALAYATSLAPFLAANVLTPDTPLAFFTALSYLFYWRAEEAETTPRRLGGGALLGLALGLGALAKGPAILVMASPLVVVAAIRRRSVWRWLADLRVWIAAAVFAAIALSWYGLVVRRVPGALAYILDNQVMGRLVTAEYQRNAQWYGALRVYLPTLLLGALPWTPLLLARLPRLPGVVRGAWGSHDVRRLPELFVVVAFLLPLAVFMVARSRLPLYVLPLWTPLALAAGRALAGSRVPLRRLAAGGAIWIALLGATKLWAAHYAYPGDTRKLAATLAEAGVAAGQAIDCVDLKANALPIYGYRRIDNVTLQSTPYPFFTLPESVGARVEELRRDRATGLFLVRTKALEKLLAALRGAGATPSPGQAIDGGYTLVPLAAPAPPPGAG